MRRRRRRTRVAVLSAVGSLTLAGLVQYAPGVVATTDPVRAAGRRQTAVSGPPADWSRHGRQLGAAQAYPSVAALRDAGGDSYCSGSVVHSPTADLVVTAAHCVYREGGHAADLSVAPGATGGSSPHGSWRVERLWIDPRYTEGGDENFDYAFLRVARPDGVKIEDAVGGNTLAVDQPLQLPNVTTTGYPDSDPDGRQLTCTMGTHPSAAHRHYREMHCGGYTTGVSGAPWVLPGPGGRTGRLVGIVGGWNGGGPADGDPHEDAISYSPYFTGATLTLLDRAVRGEGGAQVGS